MACLLAMAGCASPETKSPPPSTLPEFVPEIESTAYSFPEVSLPNGWSWEETVIEDSAESSMYTARFPQAPDSLPWANALISKAVHSRIEYEAAFVDPHMGESPSSPKFTFDMGLTGFYQDASKLSLRFVIDCYTEGGNHHNYAWYAINIDLKKRSLLGFKDVFRLRGQRDSLAFVELVHRHADDPDCMDWGLPFDSVEFVFQINAVEILPDLSWACGMNRSTIPKDSLKRFLR